MEKIKDKKERWKNFPLAIAGLCSMIFVYGFFINPLVCYNYQVYTSHCESVISSWVAQQIILMIIIVASVNFQLNEDEKYEVKK